MAPEAGSNKRPSLLSYFSPYSCDNPRHEFGCPCQREKPRRKSFVVDIKKAFKDWEKERKEVKRDKLKEDETESEGKGKK